MSVFADILVLAALIAAAWLGAKRGLLKSLAGLLIVVVALLGASWAADHLTEPVAQWIEPRVTQRVEQKIEESHAADAGQMLQALSFRGDSLQKLLDTVSQRVQETGESLIRAVSLSVARSVASTAVYVVVFLVSVNDTFNPRVLSKSQAVGMNTNTLLPSIPFHMKVSLGSWLNWFQAILVVRK